MPWKSVACGGGRISQAGKNFHAKTVGSAATYARFAFFAPKALQRHPGGNKV
ncbi:hypothetical protein GEOBRER4_n0015 [Citrifermentans bremense]|uniref:Uncharacterized protein n=2 Tax=Geobacteraceae TaxID=213422 RepID=A0ABQ0MMJ9_9BACT|nr:hypothetical protein GEOBRER4_n0015 [Citrifermentans bremense]GAW68310.1 hypothetical protein GPEL0_01f4591 [Geoanaerobacter pelophilus]